MIDHTGIIVSDFEKSKEWYTKVLKLVGYEKIFEFNREATGDTSGIGFGEIGSGKPNFWLIKATNKKPAHRPSIHIAFRAKNRDMVDNFFYGAIATAKAKDNGKPGIRGEYHSNYYGAFVLDPDGHNIEAVCHLPEHQMRE